MRRWRTLSLGSALRAEILQKSDSKSLRCALKSGRAPTAHLFSRHASRGNYSKLNSKLFKILYWGAPVAHPFWGVALRARNYSKSIQNQIKSAPYGRKLFKIIFKIIQIFRRDVGMVCGVEKLWGIIGNYGELWEFLFEGLVGIFVKKNHSFSRWWSSSERS